jgi:hypothetical protein
MSGGGIFSFLVIALLSCSLIYRRVRQSRNRKLDAWVQNQTVIYDCPVLVRQCVHPGGNWFDWSRRVGGEPRLLVRAGAIEIRAPQGMVLDSRDICLRADTARMWPDEVGWAGSALGSRECIHLVGRDETAEVELALSPLSDFGEAWDALRRAGVVAASSADPTAPRRRLDIWLSLPLVCFVVVGLYMVLAPFSEAWNVGRVGGVALFLAVGRMRARHDRRERPM